MKNSTLLMLIVMLFCGIIRANASTAEVTKSGSTWTAKVDGTTVYTGSRMFDAVNAACNNAGDNSTINVRNSGDSGDDGGSVYAIKPRSNQVLDFHDNTINCNSSGELAVAIYADRKSNITVKNVTVTGTPRYGFWFLGCHNVTFTDITMRISNDQTIGLGIRYEGRSHDSSNLTINGTIDIESNGHSIETYTVDGVTIDKVTVKSKNGCGVLLNDSEDCVINEIWAYNCNTGGSYAGFRQANDNGKTYCKYLRAKNCGRGMYTITSSHNVTVDEVDIDDCTSSGISVTGTGYNVRVNSGSISNSNKNIDLWDGYSDVCIKVNDSSYGDACSSSEVSGIVDGTVYQIKNRNTGLFMDGMGNTTNGDDVGQWANTSHNNAHWKVEAYGSYYRIKNYSTGLYLDGMGLTSNGSNVGQWANTTSSNAQWSIEEYGDYYRIKNRSTGLYIDGMGLTSNGSFVGQWANTTHANAQWVFTPTTKSAKLDADTETTELKGKIYPTIVSDILNIELTDIMGNGATVTVYSSTGKLVKKVELSDKTNTVDVSDLSQGFYFVTVFDGSKVIKQKIIKNN